MHASSNTSALVLISNLVDVRFIFPLTAFNNFPTYCFKQFDCDRLRRNYIYISQNWDFWMYSLITYKNFGTTIFYLFFLFFSLEITPPFDWSYSVDHWRSVNLVFVTLSPCQTQLSIYISHLLFSHNQLRNLVTLLPHSGHLRLYDLLKTELLLQ